MLVQKKTRDEIATTLRSEFHWADLHVNVSLNGAMVELQ
jgi:hypothetical protein